MQVEVNLGDLDRDGDLDAIVALSPELARRPLRSAPLQRAGDAIELWVVDRQRVED